ncbi:MAG: 23S rRNA (uracil(1939)-C(5))-methyltransferase RlmD [Bacteroidetes bacterium]|nr:MAG: 23S rRNA (uracil(1939)-C(5))-methyltransferase RlmD [Bacteroidota bacterium]TAG89703.1 MAG: 23S rRNA (uracil(1939)-C(5))-methyltransferase RlmD [Bacteroidota bacterium]
MSRKKKPLPIHENLTVLRLGAEGKAITKYNDKVIFLEGNTVAVDDIVDVQIFRQKTGYSYGKVIKYHHLSEKRTAPICEHFGVCGGCKWQHLPYQVQLEAKQQQVIDNLTRLAKVDLPPIKPILASKKIYNYRNKLEFTFSNFKWLDTQTFQKQKEEGTEREGGLGFHLPGHFDKVLEINHCHLQQEPSNAIREAVKKFTQEKKWAYFNLKHKNGFLRNLLIRNSNTGDLMVALIFFEDKKEEIKEILSFLQQQFPEITSLQYFINPKNNDSYADLTPILFAGKPYIEEKMDNLIFRVGAKSFYQTNPEQAYNLYKIAVEMANLKGTEIVYDLYTGTGTIAQFVAQKAKKVIGIEYIQEAIDDANANAKLNQLNNISFFAGDMKDILNEIFIADNGKPDVIITDPPRAGMHEDVIAVIKQASPQKIVYVSCNPATQARDINLLSDIYELADSQAVDMFPQTYHVENVVLLVKKSASIQ